MKTEEITTKDLYEKFSHLEGKLDRIELTDIKTNNKFTKYVYWLLTLSIINILIHLILMVVLQK